MSVQYSKGFEHEKKNCLHVCLTATSLLSSFLKSNNNFIYVKRRQSFFVKAYTCE